MYIDHICLLSNIQKNEIRSFASGDDSFVFIERGRRDDFVKGLWNVYHATSSATHGLGQQVKEVF